MKLIHIADIHLGAKPEKGKLWGEEREREIYETFSNVINCCNQEEVDLLLIAGDLFHKQPSMQELKEVNCLFEQLNKTRVVIIAGNRDYISPCSNYIEFEWCNQVVMLKEKKMRRVYFEDINTEIYGLSYHTRDIYEALYQRVQPIQLEHINILLAHGGDDRNIPINRKLLEQAGFDYVALGHIHKPQQIGERMVYAGSLEPLDKSELGEHGYYMVNIQKEDMVSEVSIELIPCAKRKYRRLEVQVTSQTTNHALYHSLRKAIQEFGVQDLYRVCLKGIRNPNVKFQIEDMNSPGNIIELVDLSYPDYNFEQLKRENEGNLIGLYIEQIQAANVSQETKRRALYYGLDTLLKGIR